MRIFSLYVMYSFFFSCVPLDVSCQIRRARRSSLSVGGVRQANLFPGNDIRDAVSGAVLQGRGAANTSVKYWQNKFQPVKGLLKAAGADSD